MWIFCYMWSVIHLQIFHCFVQCWGFFWAHAEPPTWKVVPIRTHNTWFNHVQSRCAPKAGCKLWNEKSETDSFKRETGFRVAVRSAHRFLMVQTWKCMHIEAQMSMFMQLHLARLGFKPTWKMSKMLKPFAIFELLQYRILEESKILWSNSDLAQAVQLARRWILVPEWKIYSDGQPPVVDLSSESQTSRKLFQPWFNQY